MPRTRKPKIALTPAQKKEQRRIRREARKAAVASGDVVATSSRAPEARSAHQEDQFWLGIRARHAAMKILNYHQERPYWLSIPFVGHNPPVSGYFPCSMFKRGGRWHYGFLFREHRDAMFRKFKGARKEMTQ